MIPRARERRRGAVAPPPERDRPKGAEVVADTKRHGLPSADAAWLHMDRPTNLMVINSVAALSQFNTPLLIVRKSSTGSLRSRRILVASDGNEGSDRIVELAGGLGASQGAQVTLVNALTGESKMNPRVIQAQAHALKRALPGAGEPLIEPGKAWDVILNAANSTKADMIVMDSRRLGGLRALGSVSRRAAHDAPCSALLLPPSVETRAVLSVING